jgi:tRNA (guanine37-N1)-methyltransferase
MKRFHIITLFPEAIAPYLHASILKRAQEKKLVHISLSSPRSVAAGKHKKTDDRPYGGGPGMVMYAQPILRAVEKTLGKNRARAATQKQKTKIILFSPNGKQFTNAYAQTLSQKYTDIVLIAGRYEGVDARVKKILRAEELSVGPYVLTGGEIPALIVVDAVTRRIKGVLGKETSIEENRTASHEMYTRPEVLVWKGKSYRVPAVLRSGHHTNIDKWRKDTHK